MIPFPARIAPLVRALVVGAVAVTLPRAVLAQQGVAGARARGPVAAIPSYDRTAPLHLRDSLLRADGALAIHRVSFDSPLGGRATGLLLVPSDSLRPVRGRFAGLLMLHGAPGDARAMLSRAEGFARHGAVALILDAPFARRDPRRPISLTSRDSADVVQLAVDLRRAVDVLIARPDVDSTRLGFVGVSYGGAHGALLAGIEHRIRAYVLQVADGGLSEHFTNDDGSLYPPFDGVADSTWRRWHAAMRPVGSIHFVGSAVPGSILFQWATLDVLVPPANARRLLAASHGQTVKWYESGHALPPQAQADALAWLGLKIGLGSGARSP